MDTAADSPGRKKLKYTQIFACDEAGLIGRANGNLPWSYPEDLAHFKEVTSGPNKAVMMGYNTWKSLPVGRSREKLLGRKKLVLTRKSGLKPLKDTFFIDDWSVAYVSNLLLPLGITDLYIIGGKDILEQTVFYCSDYIVSYINQITPQEPGDVRISLGSYRHLFSDRYLDKVLENGLIKVYRQSSMKMDEIAPMATSTGRIYTTNPYPPIMNMANGVIRVNTI